MTKDERPGAAEVFAVVLLSVTTVLTAWSAFQATKWSGAMSIAFSQASSARIEASRFDGDANTRASNQIQLWTAWLSATTDGDDPLAAQLVERFPEPLATAHQDWLDAGGVDAQPEASSPFVLDSYRLPEQTEARASDARADERFATALRNNQRGDNYTLLTVLFAAVLFFTALATRFASRRIEVAMLAGATVLFTAGAVLLLTFPKLV